MLRAPNPTRFLISLSCVLSPPASRITSSWPAAQNTPCSPDRNQYAVPKRPPTGLTSPRMPSCKNRSVCASGYGHAPCVASGKPSGVVFLVSRMVTIITLYPKGYKKAKERKREREKSLKSIGTDMCHLAFCVGEAGALWRNISFLPKLAAILMPAPIKISSGNSHDIPKRSRRYNSLLRLPCLTNAPQ